MIIPPDHDPMGQAIEDHFTLGRALHRLVVKSEQFDDDEMPVGELFRDEYIMPPLEQMALSRCSGHVLDVGAAAGRHTLALEARGLQVTSIDVSQISTRVRNLRGVKDARCADFFVDDFGTSFDTIILLMNGLGIAGTLNRLPRLLNRCKDLLAAGGRILADSTDLRYVFEDGDGVLQWDEADGYYGEVDYRMEYGNCRGERFGWLYVDFDTLRMAAASCGLEAVCIGEGKHYDYLAEIKVKQGGE